MRLKEGLVPCAQVFTEKGGFNAEILYYTYPDGRVSVLAKYGAKKGGFTYQEAVEKYHDIIEYQNELLQRSVPLPNIERLVIEYDHAAEQAVVIKTSPWTGQDVHSFLQQPKQAVTMARVRTLIDRMCAILVPICKERIAGWETRIGIDPRCSNFTVDAKGKMWFVDLFPPRFRKRGQPMIEWPEPKNEIGRRLGYFKHYDVRGIILCMTAQLARVRPDLKGEIEKIAIHGMHKSMTAVERKAFATELNQTPWIRVRESLQKKLTREERSRQMKNLIEGCFDRQFFNVTYNVYTLREIALELASAKLMSQSELDKFFCDSHFEDELPRALVEELEQRLITIGSRPKR